MQDQQERIGFGGGCHWCTEAIFSSLKGVVSVDQGWIAPANDVQNNSEAVIVQFQPRTISLERLIAIHLSTHSSSVDHSRRWKYRSAIYTYTDSQFRQATQAITVLQSYCAQKIITQVLPLHSFRQNDEWYLNYYYRNPQKPFCINVIDPKLRQLLQEFTADIDSIKLEHLL
jgi:peptide-methionine (S)-S-oxide reductase